MKHVLVSIKDTAIQAFGPAFTVRHQGEAMRNFADAINDPQNKSLNQHPEDYELHYLGDFNDETGEINSAPRILARGVDVKRN